MHTDTYQQICQQWVHTLLLNSESQIHIWPPLTCAYTLLHQLSQDKELQKQLFGNKKYTLLYIDGYEASNPTWEEFEHQFFHAIHVTPERSIDMDDYISAHPDTIFGIFLVGYDSAIAHQHTTILKHIGSLLEKHEKLSVIFLSEQNIVDSPLYMELIHKHMLVENIFYQPLYCQKDIAYFLDTIEKKWEYTIAPEAKAQMITTIGGHPLLLEEAARTLRELPHLSVEQLLSSPTLIKKARTIFRALSLLDQESIRNIANQKPETVVSEYLTNTQLVKNGRLGLPYWEYLHQYHPEVKLFADTKPSAHIEDMSHILTLTEKHIFDALVQKNGTIMHREDIAKILWNSLWEEKYSDWAIDQVLHRLREKLNKHNTVYTITTKKGEGFLLLNK